jgi:protein CpxP
MNPTLKRTLTTTAATLLAAGAVVTLVAWGGGCHRSHRHDPAEVSAFVTDRVDDALDDLDATAEQRTRLHAVKDRMLASGLKFHDASKGGKEVVLEAWKSPNPDAARLHALVDQRFDEMRALAHQAVDAGVEVHGVLTPEQREKVTRKIERRMGR